MSGRGLHRNNVINFQFQAVNIAVETLSGVLEPDFNNIIVTYVEGEVGKPVVLIKLVCPDCVFYFRLWRLLAGLDLYILVYHNIMLTAGGRKGQFHAFRKGECKIRNKRAIIK